MAKVTRNRGILCEIEASYGTDPTPTASANYIRCRSLEIEPLQADTVERETIRPYFGNYDILLANQRVALTIEVELAGSGTAGTAPAWDPLMRSCANSVTTVTDTSVTYAPESSTHESCTIYYFDDGIRHEVKGNRGSWSLSAEVGQIPVLTFSMIGIFASPADVSLGAVTEQNQAAPVLFKNGNTTSFEIFGFAGALQSYSFDCNNESVYRELVGGTKEVLITDRKPGGSMTIEAVSLSSHNFFTDATGSSTGTNDFQHGQTAGNICTFSCPQTDIGSIGYEDSDGVRMLNLPFVALPTSAGNNEYSLAIT
ncbi:MAG TPA: hypothetical protein DCG72_02760 [Gammaproteobacteria bacterium]|nr:hypothetical protein [Gammaproteobacteria bacterium]